MSLMRCDVFSQVLLDHAIRLRVHGVWWRLAHSQALQNLLYQMRLKVTVLVTMQFPRYSEVAEEVGNLCFHPCRSLLIGNDVGFRLLRKIIHCHQEISVSLVTPSEGPCYIDGYPFERGTNVVLLHWDPIHGSGAGCGDWLHRCRTAGTTSQHRFLPGPSQW
jgi:hypothetical protein